MENFTLTAELRETTGRSTDALRTEGIVPAVLYGFEVEPINIKADRNAVEKLYREAGESSVITLTVDGKEYSVLLQDLQRDPLTDFITHADFRSVNMNQVVEAAISLDLVGEAPAVKELGGTLIQTLEELEVKALPSALVSSIEVDVSALKTLEDVIHVSDLTIPAGIEVLEDADRTVASVSAPRTAAEMEALDEAVEGDVNAVEVANEKKDKEESAE